MAVERASIPVAEIRPHHKSAAREAQATLISLLYLLPSLAAFTVFIFYPLVKSVWISMHADNPFGGLSDFIGLRQYRDALTSSDYRNSLKITVLYALYTVPLGIFVSLGLATLANVRVRGISIFRVVFAITIGVSVAAASVIYAMMYNPSAGVLNYFLTSIGLPRVDWLTKTRSALWAITLLEVWLRLGFNFIVLLSGMQGIPEELYESARIDGAGSTRTFFSITLPLLSPSLFFVGVISVISAFQSFAQIDILTKGGPAGATNVAVYSIYLNAFRDFHTGYASAQAVLLFIILVVLTVIQFRGLESKVTYQ
jgi:sn-glycerol 3-phosphate transport system permease protein